MIVVSRPPSDDLHITIKTIAVYFACSEWRFAAFVYIVVQCYVNHELFMISARNKVNFIWI